MDISRLPEPAVVRQLLRYDPETGKLFWRERGPEWFTDSKKQVTAEHKAALWNGQYAGKEAFTCVYNGYRRGALCGRGVRAHRVAWVLYYGEWPSDCIDHINGVGTDNRISNLRAVSNAENTRNAKKRTDNTSGVVGVNWVQRDQRWHARIGNRSLGYYVKKSEAVAVRKAAEVKYGFHPNHGR